LLRNGVESVNARVRSSMNNAQEDDARGPFPQRWSPMDISEEASQGDKGQTRAYNRFVATITGCKVSRAVPTDRTTLSQFATAWHPGRLKPVMSAAPQDTWSD
jgi:hypothetical protein